jgi:hypothetical protein
VGNSCLTMRNVSVISLLEQVIFLWPQITLYRLSWLFQISNVWLGLKLFTSIYLWFEIFNLKYINESYFYKITGRGWIIIKLHVKHEHPGITEPIFKEYNYDKIRARQQNNKFASLHIPK